MALSELTEVWAGRKKLARGAAATGLQECDAGVNSLSGYFKAALRLYNPAQAGHPPAGSDSACEPAAAFFDTHELLSCIFFFFC